jgi:hypothetical protein
VFVFRQPIHLIPATGLFFDHLPFIRFFVAAPHPVAMEFDLFKERWSSHWVKGGGVSKRELQIG